QAEVGIRDFHVTGVQTCPLPILNFGASIRATMNLVLAAKVRALMEGRYHVTAEDLKKLALPILRHRVLPNYYAESDNISIDQIQIGRASCRQCFNFLCAPDN